jgi:hypothetical protein
MSENEEKTQPNKGSRIVKAREAGVKAARKGKAYANPYERPNMLAAFEEGYNSVPDDEVGADAKDAKRKAKPAAE